MGNKCEDMDIEHDWDDSYQGDEEYCSRCGMSRSEYEQAVRDQRGEDTDRDAVL